MDDGPVELLAQGGDDRGRDPFSWSQWARAHPRGLVSAVVVVLVGALVGGFGYVRSGPKLPSLSSARAQLNTDTPEVSGTWAVGADGRPAAPPIITVYAVLRFSGVGAEGVQLAGMAGPGLSNSSSSVQHVADGTTSIATQLRSTLDCSQIALPASTSEYGLAVTVAQGSRTAQGALSSADLVRRWTEAVNQACGSWAARTNLTVNAISGTAAPVRPEADLRVTVSNRGSVPATLSSELYQDGGFTVSRDPAGSVVVAPRSSATLSMHVTLPYCDQVPVMSDTLTLDDSTLLGLTATTGPPPVKADVQEFVEGTGPTGVLLSEGAASALAGVLGEACGGLTSVVALLKPGAERLDRAKGQLSLGVLLDLPPGKVSDLTLASAQSTGALSPDTFVPLWRTTPTLVPDATGQVGATLTYRLPKGATCPFTGAVLPGFTVVAHVQEPAGVRTVRYALGIIPWEDPATIALLCPGLTLTEAGGVTSQSVSSPSASPSG